MASTSPILAPSHATGTAPGSQTAGGAAWLPSIQRLDAQASSVLLHTSFTVLYKWDDAGEEWRKESVEGPFVLAGRMANSGHDLVIFNRLSTKTSLFCLPNGNSNQTHDVDVSVTDKLVFFRLGADIYVIFFASSNAQEMNQVAKLFVKHLHAELLKPQPLFASGVEPVEAPTKGEAEVQSQQPRVLSKEEFKDALISLICEDKALSTMYANYLEAKQQQAQMPPPFSQQAQQQQHYPQQSFPSAAQASAPPRHFYAPPGPPPPHFVQQQQQPPQFYYPQASFPPPQQYARYPPPPPHQQ